MDAAYWDERYGTLEYAYGTEPNAFLMQCASRLSAGSDVLAIGDGEGRNGCFLAGLGHRVTSIDRSAEGKRKADLLAAERGVSLDFRVADLADADLGIERFDAAVSIFCHMPSAVRKDVHRRIVAALRPGGLVILEAYCPAQLAFGTGGPKDRDMLISLADALDEFAGLDFLVAQEVEREVVEGRYHTGRAAVTQIVACKA